MIYAQLSDWVRTYKPTDKHEKDEISGGKHFSYKNMSEQYFLEKLQEGHGFCPLHRSKEQAATEQTNIIVFDFDYNTLPINEFVTSLPIKPTFTYYSYSTGKWNLYRYRLIYQLFTPIRGYQYDAVFQHIAATNQWQKCPPHKKDEPPTPEMFNTYDGLARNQYFFSGTDITYYADNVIDYTPTTTKPNRGAARQNTTTTANGTHPPRQTKPKGTKSQKYTKYKHYSDSFVDNIDEYIPSPYKIKINYLTHTQLPETDADTPIILYPSNYIETPRKFAYDKHKKSYGICPYRDGENRHKKLFITGIILRKLNPKLNHIQLLKALLREFYLYYDNSDDKYTMNRIMAIADAVLDADVSIELKRWRKPKYIVNKKYCDKHLKSKRQVCGMVNAKMRREATFANILEHYDPQKSDIENLITLRKKGVKVSQRTLTLFKSYYKTLQPPKSI